MNISEIIYQQVSVQVGQVWACILKSGRELNNYFTRVLLWFCYMLFARLWFCYMLEAELCRLYNSCINKKLTLIKSGHLINELIVMFALCCVMEERRYAGNKGFWSKNKPLNPKNAQTALIHNQRTTQKNWYRRMGQAAVTDTDSELVWWEWPQEQQHRPGMLRLKTKEAINKHSSRLKW